MALSAPSQANAVPANPKIMRAAAAKNFAIGISRCGRERTKIRPASARVNAGLSTCGRSAGGRARKHALSSPADSGCARGGPKR
jgi:hypothetical protein